MCCRASARGLFLALLAAAASAVRPPARGRAAPAAAAELGAPNRSAAQLPVQLEAALPPVLATEQRSRPRAERAEYAEPAAGVADGQTVPRIGGSAAASPGRPELRGSAGGYAFPQTLEGAAAFMRSGAEIRRWLVHAALRKETLMWVVIIETILLVATVGGPLIIWAGTRFLGNTIEAGIEHFDKDILGVDVEIERITPNLIYGILDVEHLVVKNPANKGYDSEYLLKANHVHIDIDMLHLFTSCFSKVRIEKVIFSNLDVIYEKGWSSSNVQDVLNFLTSEQASKKEERKALEDPFSTSKARSRTPPTSRTAQPEARSVTPPRTPKGQDATPQAASCSSDTALQEKVPEPPAKGGGLDVTLHEVCIEDVGARAQAKMLGGRGFRIAISDIYFKDFAKEMGIGMLDDIIVILLKSVLKTVLANIIGKRFGDQCM